MITINYQTFGNKGFQLRLRFYQDGETKYINVTKMLKGSIQKKHWNKKKQSFIPSCPFSEENNSILVQFKSKYEKMAINWTGTVYGLIVAANGESDDDKKDVTISGYIQIIIERLTVNKHADGSMKGSFEDYPKFRRPMNFVYYQ